MQRADSLPQPERAIVAATPPSNVIATCFDDLLTPHPPIVATKKSTFIKTHDRAKKLQGRALQKSFSISISTILRYRQSQGILDRRICEVQIGRRSHVC
jgi:hypothetical protein